ncbi:MAG: glycosyltransferase, partial [Spirochaetes bacterium]|nr:glycosyltransferase [Spirochaetota bacterium]
MSAKRVLIVAGGTGGHISPGIALYEEFKARACETYVLMGRRDARFSYVKNFEGKVIFYSAPSFSKNPFLMMAFPVRFAIAVLVAKKILKKYAIEAVIGMGGYVSAPALFAARAKKIPFYLCEQNSIPGKVTKYFAPYAEAVFSTFESTREHLQFAKRVVCVGNPLRRQIFSNEGKARARELFNMKHCKKVLLVIGGSQGAVKLNELIVGLKKMYHREFKDIGIIWSTGEYSYAMYKNRLHREDIAGSVFLSPFLTNVGAAYRACDVAISRAGAGA